MDSMCQKCGGRIGGSGEAYGWVGKWCHCVQRVAAELKKVPL